MSILESQDQIESEIVIQESARTTKIDQNPMNSEEVSVAEGQEDSARDITNMGEHMII